MKKDSSTVPTGFTAKQFIEKLKSLRSPSMADHRKFLKDIDTDTRFMGVRMANIFGLARHFKEMPLREVEKLLNDQHYEARMGAVSIMDFQARDKKCQSERKRELYELYITHHDRINNWDLVDRSAPYVVGGYLFDKSRKPLYKLAKSLNVCERRTAIVATYFFIRQNDTADTFGIAEKLVYDKSESINMAVGSWIREAGKRDRKRLLDFLDKYASTMPRVTLRYAIEKLDKKLKNEYMNSGK